MPSAALQVLIVDDDIADRHQIRRALQSSGLQCECTEVDSAAAALEACQANNFDCAFVDYRMPGQDGLFAVTALREVLPYLAIIMSTGQGDELVATEAMQRGAADYLPKAFLTAQTIARSAQNALEKAVLRRKVAQQQEELESFARVLVHDFKQPINSVLGFASLIERGVEEGKTEQIRMACQRITRALRRMGELLDTLHAYTQAEERVDFEPVDMRDVMADTLANLDDFIKRRGARVSMGDLPTVIGNAAQISQLLQNLIGNGIKYCQAPEPTIQVEAKRHEENMWLFTVKDNGIGIPETSLRAVFEPFKRLHGMGRYEGTGLGLATCKRIVERHAGAIWCESAGRYGSTFLFTLPGAQTGCTGLEDRPTRANLSRQ
jgi:signal transduction histidine kinase